MLRTRQFGSYEIIRKLGRGMTDVYLAFDTATNRHAVLKIVEESPDPMTQLVIEAERRGAALQRQLHDLDPRVIEVFEYGDRDGCFFLSMQHIEGRTVAAILKEEKRIDPARAARFAAEICNQLDKLHSFHAEIDGQRRAVVHGDIKPANIQIGNNDEVRLLDFGIAKAITFTHNLTHHNLGSPSYCSPERLAQGKVDHQADLWALAVTLFEMLGGSPPYQAQDTRKLENLIRSRRPPRALPDGCPSPLKAIVGKALSGDLHQRYVSAAAFEADLRAFLRDQPTVAERERRVSYNTNATVEKPKPNGAGLGAIADLGATVARKPAGLVLERLRPAFPKGWSTQRIAGVLGIFTALCWGALAGLLIAGPAGYYYRFLRESAPLRDDVDYGRASIADINSNWELYQRLIRKNAFLGRFSPATALTAPLRGGLQAAADEAIDGYRNGSDTDLRHFDWQKSVACSQYLLRLDGRDKTSRERLALANGYVDMLRGDANSAKSAFDDAVLQQARDPDPHLGLARLQVYVFHNVGAAVAELRAAEKLGYRLGPREIEQEADAYRYRAAQELNKARGSASRAEAQRYLRLAQHDFDQARQLYEPIEGFSTVSAALQEVDDSDRARQRLDDDLSKPPTPKKRYPVVWRRRWQ